MKGLGNYRFQRRPKKGTPKPNVERRPGLLLEYRGRKAIARFHNGQSYGLPAEPLQKIGVKPGQRFRLIIVRVAGEVQEVRVEPLAPPRPPRPKQSMPKVVVRDGRKLTTRK